jgi:hypothetical protein
MMRRIKLKMKPTIEPSFSYEPSLSYEEKITFLRNKLRDHANPKDLGWTTVSELLGLSSGSKLKKRLVNGLHKREWDLAAEGLIRHVKYQDELDKFSYTIK